MAGERDHLISLLHNVNYYRLSAYLFPFRKNDGTEDFKPGANLGTVVEIYRFDEELRNTLVAGLEKVEVSLRANIAYQLSHSIGPFGYTNEGSLPDLSSGERMKLLIQIEEEKDRSKEVFKDHFVRKYGDSHKYLPIWIAVELMSFGTLHSLFRGIDYKLRQRVADSYGIDQVVLGSWTLALNTLRNLCAHHSRIWNREFGIKPRIPHKAPPWTEPFQIANNRLMGLASVLAYLTHRIDQGDGWKRRFLALLTRYPAMPVAEMGFPRDWEKHLIWK